jgi:NADH pyrophosphatase NudC (nudix superfamily)
MTLFTASKVIVTHPHHDRFLLLKQEKNGVFTYAPAGGRVEVDFDTKSAETLEVCAHREIKEELGISIDHLVYVGSYFFFWSKREHTCSICALFLAQMREGDKMNAIVDEGCYPGYPEWVCVDDILHGHLPLNPSAVGLPDLMKKAVLMCAEKTHKELTEPHT